MSKAAKGIAVKQLKSTIPHKNFKFKNCLDESFRANLAASKKKTAKNLLNVRGKEHRVKSKRLNQTPLTKP